MEGVFLISDSSLFSHLMQFSENQHVAQKLMLVELNEQKFGFGFSKT